MVSLRITDSYCTLSESVNIIKASFIKERNSEYLKASITLTLSGSDIRYFSRAFLVLGWIGKINLYLTSDKSFESFFNISTLSTSAGLCNVNRMYSGGRSDLLSLSSKSL